MAVSSAAEIAELINALSHRTTASFIGEAQALTDQGLPATVATSLVLDAALMAAASFLQTAVFNGAVRTTVPVEELLPLRLGELLAMPRRIFPQRPDGSFDPVGLPIN
ncbi:hypothetical protein [Bosea sp. (in: a-proteobacteria)]|jgi:hypothetical protein|uniref:hypothetical protein n=1 Tax=Bosea sp. (in: a-proteobacteria) TaxID=1871050 RepID=UPI003567E144